MARSPGEETPRPDELEPGTQVDRWRVVEALGVGGQGAVYRVEDLHHPGDFYALKLALYPRDARAEREAVLMMSRAAHPNVAGFHGCARWPHPREGCLGFVMDWVPSQSLDTWAETAGTTFRRLVRALSDVILRLSEKDPARRYPSGAALHEALVKAARGKESAWDASIFEWEEFPPPREGAAAERHIVLPARPRLEWPTSPPGAPVTERGNRGRRRLALAVALLLLLPVTRLAWVSLGVRIPDTRATATRMDPGAAPSEQAPLPGRVQKRAPCTEKLEVELSGACWHSIERRFPDCPPQTVEYKGMCLWPVPKPLSLPTSMDGGEPDAR